MGMTFILLSWNHLTRLYFSIKEDKASVHAFIIFSIPFSALWALNTAIRQVLLNYIVFHLWVAMVNIIMVQLQFSLDVFVGCSMGRCIA